MLFARERGRCGPDVPLPQALQLRRSSSTPALAGQSTGWQVADPPQFIPYFAPRPGWGALEGPGRGSGKPPKESPNIQGAFRTPNFPQTHPIPQSSPKLFLAVAGPRCELMLAFTSQIAHIDG
jgi:hypothetical protein